MVKIHTLSNGAKVIAYNMPSVHSFHLRTNIKGGSLVEDKSQNGVAHFMEHMLVQGVPSYRTAEILSEFVEGIAGNYGAYTSTLAVSYEIVVPISHLEQAVNIAGQIFFEPLFTQNAIEKERTAVISEIRQKQDSRGYKLNQFFQKIRYRKNSPLRQNTVGSEKVVERLKRDDLLKYWEKYFLPQNTYIFVSGKFKEDEVLKTLEKYFGKYKAKNDFPGYPKLTATQFSDRTIAINSDKKLKVNYIDLTVPALKLTDSLELRLRQVIALVILGRLRTSRLFKLLRYQKGLVYDVGANDSKLLDLGFVNISSEVENSHLDEVVGLISESLTKFVHAGPTKEEVDFTKNYLTKGWLMAFDSPDSTADWLENELLWRDEVKLPEDYINLIKDISAKEITEMMQKYWDFKKLNLVIQGPIENSEGNIKKYENLLKDLK